MLSRIQQLQANAQPRRDQHTREWDGYVESVEQFDPTQRTIKPTENTAPLRAFMRARVPHDLQHTLHAQMIRLTQWLIDREFDDVSITHHTGLLHNNTGQEPAQTPEQQRMAQVRSHQRKSQEYKQQEYERKMYERRRNTNR